LNNSNYPDYFPKEFELEFNQDNNLLVIDYTLPDHQFLPIEKDIKFSASKNEVTKILFSEKELSERFNNTVYKILLRTIHEIFESDSIKAIDYVCINGYINHLDESTGNVNFTCIASLSVSKEEFMKLNLNKVNPEACFKNLKGVSANKLINLIPVAPIVNINKTDSRFIEGNAVLHSVDDSVNLAAMDWEEFEHLIREIFGKEFSLNGGEVKITQSSRDGGVDAVAFDPDPIRGGKVIIQAKRYTNVVGISAVRDLFGTVMNEGANKGILVTTSYFGKDAYDFAKNKPLALINGSNLLYLLGKHGHKARINIEEAKNLRK
jgi:restriction system protein